MGSFKFRIGTKLGIVTGISVLLVGGILTNQMLGNQSIAESNRLVIINYLNKGNAQSAQTAMARAQLAADEIGSAPSIGEVDKVLDVFGPTWLKPVRRSTPRRNGRRGRLHKMPIVRPRNSWMPIWPVPSNWRRRKRPSSTPLQVAPGRGRSGKGEHFRRTYASGGPGSRQTH